MKRIFRIAASLVVWALLVAWLVWAGRLGAERRAEARVERIRIVVADSARSGAVTPGMVHGWLRDAGMKIAGERTNDVNTLAIVRLVRSHLFVERVRVTTDLAGNLDIVLTQRRPMLRLSTEDGYDCYITDGGYVLPVQAHAAHYVPVVTGRFEVPFQRGYAGTLDSLANGEKNYTESYLFLSNLINFVKYIEENDFWRAQVVQINVLGSGRGKEPQIEIVPRAGDQVVLLGSLDGAPEKLEKLKLFYRGALDWEGWDGHRYIDLRFKNQIVCTK